MPLLSENVKIQIQSYAFYVGVKLGILRTRVEVVWKQDDRDNIKIWQERRIIEDWGQFHSEELHSFNSLRDQITDGIGVMSIMAGRCENFWSDNLKGRDKLGGLRLRWKDEIKVDLEGVE